MSPLNNPSSYEFPVVPQGYTTFTVENGSINLLNTKYGFRAQSYFSQDSNELVISFAGTNDYFDLLPDAALAATGNSQYDVFAKNFTDSSLGELAAMGHENVKIVLTGHSLGGYLAQNISANYPDAEVYVYSSPGLGGLTGDQIQNDNVTYVYSDPEKWGVTENSVHRLGTISSDNVYFIRNASGHSIDALNKAMLSGSPPLSIEEYRQYLFDIYDAGGEYSQEALATLLEFDEEVKRLQGELDPDQRCFSAGTLIDMADGTQKPIEQIEVGDEVLAYDPAENDGLGELKAARVTRTMVNQVEEIIDFHGVKMTPGHATLVGEGPHQGRHIPIMDILVADGAIVNREGELIRAATNLPVGSEGDRFVQGGLRR